jgi:hypothetical protein
VGLLVPVAVVQDLLQEVVVDPKVELEAVDPTQVQLVVLVQVGQEVLVEQEVADPKLEERMDQALHQLEEDPKFEAELVEQKGLLEP